MGYFSQVKHDMKLCFLQIEVWCPGGGGGGYSPQILVGMYRCKVKNWQGLRNELPIEHENAGLRNELEPVLSLKIGGRGLWNELESF